jgi:signal transduction histidine kinase
MELINNTIKHASAKNIEITIKEEYKLLLVIYSDDGVGFNVSKTLQDPKIGMGLNNIFSRIRSIQGSFILKSNLGEGVSVRIEIDVKQFTE